MGVLSGLVCPHPVFPLHLKTVGPNQYLYEDLISSLVDPSPRVLANFASILSKDGVAPPPVSGCFQGVIERLGWAGLPLGKDSVVWCFTLFSLGF